MTCGCYELPDCPAVNCGRAAPVPSQNREPVTETGAATCVCFPANATCPSAARCAATGHPGYIALLDELRAIHKTKSGGYGTTADPFGNFTAVASLSGEPRYLYPVLRAIEKLTRFMSLHAQGRVDELEEELLDVSSLGLCAAAMLRDDR